MLFQETFSLSSKEETVSLEKFGLLFDQALPVCFSICQLISNFMIPWIEPDKFSWFFLDFPSERPSSTIVSKIICSLPFPFPRHYRSIIPILIGLRMGDDICESRISVDCRSLSIPTCVRTAETAERLCVLRDIQTSKTIRADR
jgi:hypothetical protein